MACPAIELRERGRAQLAHYDNARVVHHTITAVEGDARSGFTARSQGGDWHGRALVLATGVLDHFPAGTRLAIAYAARFPDRLAALLLITPPASYLVDVPSDASTLAADRMVEPPFAAAVSAFGAGPGPSSDETFNAWQQVIAPIGYARWSDTEQAHLAAAGIH
jgi:pimeloyl-ACP methyl ester carboxylesterase